jgi:hypothetical protein
MSMNIILVLPTIENLLSIIATVNRHDETITTNFVESTVNYITAKRFSVK